MSFSTIDTSLKKCDFPDNPSPPVTTKDLPLKVIKILENAIASIDADGIQAIAKTFVGAIMVMLEIDIDDVKSPTDIKNLWTATETAYDPSSSFIKILHPHIIKVFTQAFTFSESFLINGTTFKVLSSDNLSTGLFVFIKTELDESTQEKIQSGIRKIRQKYELSRFDFKLGLRINVEETLKKETLVFDMHKTINEFTSTRRGIKIQTFDKYAVEDCSF